MRNKSDFEKRITGFLLGNLKNIPNGIWIGQPTKFWSGFSGVFVALDFQKTALHCSSSVARCFHTCSKEHVVHHPSNPGFPRCFHPWHNYIRFSTLKNDHRTCVDNKKCRRKTEVGGSASHNFLALFHKFSFFPCFSKIFHVCCCHCLMIPFLDIPTTVFVYIQQYPRNTSPTK